MKKTILLCAMLLACGVAMAQPEVRWDRHSLIIDGHRVVPVMGEVH